MTNKSVTGVEVRPIHHLDYPIGIKVTTTNECQEPYNNLHGIIIGVGCMQYGKYAYIVLLDKPLLVDKNSPEWGAITVWGDALKPTALDQFL